MSPVLSTFSGASARAFGFGYNFASSAFEHIETQTVGAGGAASVTFSSIAGTYKHLQIRWTARGTAADTFSAVQYRLNSDSGSNYAYHWLRGTGSAAGSGAGSTQSYGRVGWLLAANQTASCFAGGVSDLLDYASTSKYKTWRSLSGGDANGDGWVQLYSSLWQSTSAVTSVTFNLDGGNFAQHSTFALYGVK